MWKSSDEHLLKTFLIKSTINFNLKSMHVCFQNTSTHKITARVYRAGLLVCEHSALIKELGHIWTAGNASPAPACLSHKYTHMFFLLHPSPDKVYGAKKVISLKITSLHLLCGLNQECFHCHSFWSVFFLKGLCTLPGSPLWPFSAKTMPRRLCSLT